MEHSFHRKAFINSSRFSPLRIEVNQSEILENYNTFITQHAQPSKITFYQVIFWIQGAHANYFHKDLILAHSLFRLKKLLKPVYPFYSYSQTNCLHNLI